MALIQDPRLFTGGAVKFDSAPSVNLYAQLAARKQAKDDALNQYFTDLQTKINTAGVRVQDLDDPNFGGINKDIEAWRTNWLQNKDAIKKGGMPQQQHMAQFQEILRKINQSKQRAKTELEIGKAKFEGKYDPDEDDLNILANIGKSIYDPTSYKQDGVSEYGWGDLSPAVKDFDEKKFNELVIGQRKPGKTYGTPGEYNPQTGMRPVPFEMRYDPETIKQIADEGAIVFSTDRSAKKYANKILKDPDTPEYKKLNEAYQTLVKEQQFVQPDGKIIKIKDIMDSPQKVGMALAVLNTSGVFGSGEELKVDIEEKRKRDEAKMRLQSSLIAGRQKGSTEGKNLADYDVIGAYEGKIRPMKIKVKTGVFGSEEQDINVINANEIDENDKKLFADVKPYTAPDGTKYYKVLDGLDLEGKNGQVIYRSKVAQANLDKTALNEVDRGRLKLKPSTAQAKYNIKGKTYSESELLEMGYTLDQIKQYKQ